MITIPTHPGCPFCDYLSGAEPCAFVSRLDAVSSFLNRSQFERGATLIVPNAHHESLLDLEGDLVAQLYSEAQRIARAMVSAFGAVGFNVFSNSGVRAGQTIAHAHVHVVPRYQTSDPSKLFQESGFAVTPLHELEVLANELRNHLCS